MPPKKAVVEKSDDPVGLILAYLTKTNRPYSSTDISVNLQNKVTKTKCDKFLKELAESGEIEVNDKGKTAVYWAKQNAADSASPEELAELDVRIKELRDVIPALKLDAKNKAAELNSILSAATTEELSQDVEKLQTQKAEMEGRLKVLRSGTIKPINKQERAKTEVEYKKWESLRNRRKRCFAEVEASLIEQGLRKDELWEQCDIDDDPII